MTLAAFASSASKIESQLKESPLIFIHGIKGSTLVDNQERVNWLTGWQALGLQTPALQLPLAWNSDQQERDSLKASEVLAAVNIIPGLIGEKVYAPWLAAARNFGHPFYPFAYDWRRDNLESLAKFESLLTEVRAQHANQRVHVVAHSMGGLIALALLNKQPEAFASIDFVGVPFMRNISFLLDLHVGLPNGLNKKILSPQVLFTFPSAYALLSDDGGPLTDRTGNAIAFDFQSASAWREQRLGLFSFAHSPIADHSFDNLERFLEKTLARVKEFRALLAARRQAYPRVGVILSKSHATLARVQKQGPKSVRGWDFETLPKEPGDGRVREIAALPPAGIYYEQFNSTYQHSQLLNDPAVIDWIGKRLNLT
jgi:pimeloyl-ACP methyl ester carboxylesterase